MVSEERVNLGLPHQRQPNAEENEWIQYQEMELAKQKQRLQARGICDPTQNIFMMSRVDIVDEGDSEMFGKLFHDAFTEPMSAKVNEIMQQTIEGNDSEITCKNHPIDLAIVEMFKDIIRV